MKKIILMLVSMLMLSSVSTVALAETNSTVVNHSGKTVWLVWQAWGCAGIISYDIWQLTRVCNYQVSLAGSQNTYVFKWGTTDKRVYVFGGDDNLEKHIWYYQDFPIQEGGAPLVLNKNWDGHSTSKR